jgi:NagD protein
MKPGATSLHDCAAILLDIGGTLKIGDSAVPGAKDFLKALRKRDLPHFILSNTTTVNSAELLAQLNDLGLHLEPEQLITANTAAIRYMKARGIKSVFLIGTESQRRELEEHGILVSDEKASTVLVSLDTALDYQKLAIADYLVRNGANYLATNADTHFVTENGLGPDAGGTVGFLRATTGREPLITGKPSQVMLDLVLERLQGVAPTAQAHDLAMIGDQLEADMQMAQDFGLLSVLVLSGKTQRDDLDASGFAPDYVVESVANLTPLFA